MEKPLRGVRVIEVAMWVAGPSTAAVLADWGADVIKLESPNGGDPIRGMSTRAMGDDDVRVCPPYELDNRNKRSVAVDLRRPEGLEFAMNLVESADVFITSLRSDTLSGMKLDYASLSARNPRLIYAALNGYGHRGPDRERPAFDYAAAWARSGLMATITEPGDAPPAQRPGMIDHAAGLGLAGAISAALFQREKSGQGTEVRISLFSMGLWMNATDLAIGLMSGRPPVPESRLEPLNAIWNRYRCKDGKWVYFVMPQADRHWPDFCAALGHGEWKDDPRFRDADARKTNSREITTAIADVVATRSLAQWGPVFDRHELIWAPVQTDAEALDDPQANAIGAFVPIEHPSVPGCRVVASPVEFGDHGAAAYAPAPQLGQSTEEVALELGLSWEHIAKLKDGGVLG